MTWNLILQSFSILRRDRQLILFPVLSALAAIAVSIPFLLALFAGASVHLDRWTPMHYALTFLWYSACAFVIVFFNCALAACAQIRFSGGEPTLGAGIAVAGSKTANILLWAIVSSTVGVALRAISDRVGLIGKIVVAICGGAWSLVTYLIVPVLVLEDRDVIDSIRRSGQLLRDTWGEQLVAGLHFGWIGLALAIPGIVLAVLAWPVAILYFVLLAAVLTAARQVFVVALYRFATTGQAPSGYSPDALHGAFRPR